MVRISQPVARISSIRLADLRFGFAETDHKARLREKRRILFLAIPQHLERPLVTRLRTHGCLQIPNRFHIVVKHLRMCINHNIE